MANMVGDLFQLGDETVHLVAVRKRQFAGDEIDRLDTVRALIDRRNARITQIARGSRLLDEAHAAMHLNA
jgi:hypothetical protein